MNTRTPVLALTLLAGAAAAQPRANPAPAVPYNLVEGPAALALAQRLGLPARYDFDNGVRVLERFEFGVPVYIGTDNDEAATTIGTNRIRLGGDLDFNLCGCGITLGIWEAGSGVRGSHVELDGRVTQGDAAAPSSNHAMHVAGTMIASGQRAGAMGMSFSAQLSAYDAADDIAEMRTEAGTRDLRISNHSYSPRYGWEFRRNAAPGVHWVYNPGTTAGGAFITEDLGFGRYNEKAQRYDAVLADNPRYLAFVSASNQNGLRPAVGTSYRIFNRAATPPAWETRVRAAGDPDPNGVQQGGYDSIPGDNTAKNVMTIGNCRQIARYREPADVVLSASSGVGPTDDGRIKPDVVAGGEGVFSCFLFNPAGAPSDTAYGTLSGTSMATPAVSGTAGLLLQLWRDLKGWDKPDPLSSTTRALLIHTADEAGPADGPDYRFGWGLVNATQAARTLRSADTTGSFHVSEETLGRARDARYEYTVYTDAYDDEFKVTIAWIDPAGTPVNPPALNDRTRMLVNDLDLRVFDIENGQEFRPWILDPARPDQAAGRGDNTRDNVEQVVVKDFEPHNHKAWRIAVTHKGVLAADQKFSLVFSGAYQRVGCEADYNGDGFVDFFDYDAFVADFEDGSVMADLNGDHMVDMFDYSQFVDAFERGC